RKDRSSKIIAQLPIDVANYMLNEKREWVHTIQESNGVQVILLGNPDMDTPNYAIKRVRDDEAHLPEHAQTSYKLLTPKEDPSLAYEEVKRPVRAEEAAVTSVLPATPAPLPRQPEPEAAKRSGPGLFARMFGWLNGVQRDDAEEKEE